MGNMVSDQSVMVAMVVMFATTLVLLLTGVI
jgi:hypothetical protein